MILNKIAMKFGIKKEDLAREMNLRARLLYEMFKRKITGMERVQREINEYYRNPSAVLQRYGVV